MCAAVRRTPLRAVVAAVLVCAATAVAVAVAGVTQVEREPGPVTAGVHRCGFDELEAQTLGTGVSLVSDVDAAAGERSVAAAAARPWQPIRIAVFSDDVIDTSRHCTRFGQSRPNFKGTVVMCSSENVLTKAKRRTLLELLIPSAAQLHRERLSVQRESGNIVVSRDVRRHRLCGQFSIPASHMTTGVPDADFVLYMAAGPTSGTTVAWAAVCQFFRNGRPSVGVANISPRYISATPQMTRTVAHELLHGMGFDTHVFRMRNMISYVNLRGKHRSPIIATPNVAREAQAQYGCRTSAFMELEDQGGRGTVFSHWKSRNAKDELMAGSTGAGIYSAITIAAMEDLGYYRGNYSNAEPMAYGQNAGCGLLKRKCVLNGVSQFPGMFCDTNKKKMVCTSDRSSIGVCVGVTQRSPVPSYHGYCANYGLSGFSSFMDYCPVVVPSMHGDCSADERSLAGSLFGVTSRCLDTPSGFSIGSRQHSQYGICAEIWCRDTVYAIKVRGAGYFVRCKPGTVFFLPTLSPLFSSGTLTCPSYDSVCATKENAALYGKYAALLAAPSSASVPMTWGTMRL